MGDKVGTEETGILDIVELLASPTQKLPHHWTLSYKCP